MESCVVLVFFEVVCRGSIEVLCVGWLVVVLLVVGVVVGVCWVCMFVVLLVKVRVISRVSEG